jgi:hypothetical protein
MQTRVLSGGCSCGNVRYEITGQRSSPTICHCIDCRKAAAAPIVGWFTLARKDFRLTHGIPKHFASSVPVMRGFCADCGTQLTYAHSAFPDVMDVTTCSLDAPESVFASDHIHIARKLPWIHLADGLPEHLGRRPRV